MFNRKKFNNKDILVFLDVDGVLNTTNSRISKYEVRDENVNALGMLKTALENKGYVVKIVLSSTWRLGYVAAYEECSPQIQKLITKISEAGISIYDKTPVYKETTRDVEIARYIKGYELKNEEFTYIILDDDISVFDEKALKKMNFYKVDEHTGLVSKDIKKLVKLF